MTPGARVAAALELLDEIAGAKRPADVIVQEYFRRRRYAGSKDRRAVQAHVYRVLRRLGEVKARLAGLDGPVESPRAWLLADLALHGEDPMDLFNGVGHAPEPIDAAERQLVGALADAEADLPDAARLNVPPWLWPQISEPFGGDAAVELAALNEAAPVDLRVNAARGTRVEAARLLAADGVVSEETPYSPCGLRLAKRVPLAQSRAYREGWIEPQDEGSQMLALAVQARPGQTVIDLCAGGGGKTLALAADMAGQGRLVACDRSARRLKRMAPRLSRAGVEKMVEIRPLKGETDWWLEAREAADRVLVDAPCSGTGSWRRHPFARWRLTAESLQRDVTRQRLLLARAAALVKVGGWLVYTTCSVLPAENERQIDGFFGSEAGAGFRRLDVATLLNDDRLGGPDLRLTPARHGTDGVYAAVLEKIA